MALASVRYVISGGLGAGKTSALTLLEPRYKTVAEPARELIAKHLETFDPALDAASRYRYQSPVFVASPWEEIYTNDDMRRATFAQVEAFYTYVVEAYDRLGYQMIELPRASVEERAAFIIDHIEPSP